MQLLEGEWDFAAKEKGERPYRAAKKKATRKKKGVREISKRGGVGGEEPQGYPGQRPIFGRCKVVGERTSEKKAKRDRWSFATGVYPIKIQKCPETLVHRGTWSGAKRPSSLLKNRQRVPMGGGCNSAMGACVTRQETKSPQKIRKERGKTSAKRPPYSAISLVNLKAMAPHLSAQNDTKCTMHPAIIPNLADCRDAKPRVKKGRLRGSAVKWYAAEGLPLSGRPPRG